jgi:hypothetical protein
MTNWWIDELGVNNLRGVPGDPTNPVILSDDSILEFLLNIPLAQQDFLRTLPAMLPDEQIRLNAIVSRNPRALEKYPNPDPQILSDQFMNALNRTAFRFHDPNRRR